MQHVTVCHRSYDKDRPQSIAVYAFDRVPGAQEPFPRPALERLLSAVMRDQTGWSVVEYVDQAAVREDWIGK